MSLPFMRLEKFDRRFGTIAVNKGFITAKQLVRALELQVTEEIEDGKHRLIGMILHEQGQITPSQIDEVDREVMEAR